MGKIIAFPGQEQQVEEVEDKQAERKQEWYEQTVLPFIERVNAIPADMSEDAFWAEVTALRDELSRWIGGG